MRTKICAATLLALTVAGPAYAQDPDVQQSEADFYVQTSGGAAAVCGMEYSIMYIDRTYPHRDLVGVSGSLSWTELDSSIHAILIIKGVDFNATRVPIPFSVFQGFVMIDGKSVLPDRVVGNSCAGQPTDFCGAYFSEKTFALLDALAQKKRLAIGFNRQANGGFDTTLPLKIELSSNPQSTLDFSDCMSTLVDRAQTNANKR